MCWLAHGNWWGNLSVVNEAISKTKQIPDLHGKANSWWNSVFFFFKSLKKHEFTLFFLFSDAAVVVWSIRPTLILDSWWPFIFFSIFSSQTNTLKLWKFAFHFMRPDQPQELETNNPATVGDRTQTNDYLSKLMSVSKICQCGFFHHTSKWIYIYWVFRIKVAHCESFCDQI